MDSIHPGLPAIDHDDETTDAKRHQQDEPLMRMQAQILAQIPDPIVSTDLNGFIQTWNNEAANFYGYQSEEAVGRHISMLYQPDQHEFLENVIIANLLAKGQNRVEAEIITKSGEIKHVDLTLTLLKDAQGTVTGMLGYTRDITTEIQARQALRARSEQQDMLIEIGRRALAGEATNVLFQVAVDTMIGVLQVAYSQILQFLPDGGLVRVAHAGLEDARPTHPNCMQALETILLQKPVAADWVYTQHDGDELSLFSQDSAAELTIKNSVCIPILKKQELYGFLCVGTEQVRTFNSDDIHYLRSIITTLGLALEHEQARASIKSYLAQMEILHRIDESILFRRSPEEIAGSVLHYFRQLIPCTRASLTLYDQNTDEGLLIAVDSDAKSKIKIGFRFPSHFKLQNGQGFQQGEVRQVADLEQIVQKSKIEASLFAEGIRTYVTIPLFTTDRLIGSLNFSATQPGIFQEKHIEVARKVALSLAVAIQDAQLFEQVSANRLQLRKLAHDAVEAQEAERLRISRELHDHVGQALTALQISLNLVRNRLPEEYAALRKEITQASALAVQTMNDVRMLAAGLRPAELDTLGLEAALEDLCKNYTKRTGVEVMLACSSLPALPESLDISLYRIVQEALTNIVKHSNALHAWVQLSTKPEELKLIIRDDGSGFDVAYTLHSIEAHSGLGLLGISERVDLHGGQVKFYSKLGVGTTIVISIPWRAQA